MKNSYNDYFKTAKKVAAKNPNPASSITAPRAKIQIPRTTREIAVELKQKSMLKNKKSIKRKSTWKLGAVSLMGVVLTGAAFLNLGELENVFQKVEISLFSIAGAETLPPAKTPEAGKPAAASATDKAGPAAAAATAAPAEQDLSYLGKLNDRKKELDHKEEELNRLEAELEKQKMELDKKLKDLEDVRKNISSALQEKVQTDDKKVDQLVSVYSDMKAAQAAKIFETMDEDLAVEIIGRMKKKNAAEIMNLMKPEKAQAFSEKYAGYKRK